MYRQHHDTRRLRLRSIFRKRDDDHCGRSAWPARARYGVGATLLDVAVKRWEGFTKKARSSPSAGSRGAMWRRRANPEERSTPGARELLPLAHAGRLSPQWRPCSGHLGTTHDAISVKWDDRDNCPGCASGCFDQSGSSSDGVHYLLFEVKRACNSDLNVWSGRASQEVFVELAVNGLASMYPAFD